MSKWFDEPLSTGAIVQALLALVVTSIEGFAIVWGITHGGQSAPIPAEFHLLTGLVFGYYFRNRADIQAVKAKMTGEQQAYRDVAQRLGRRQFPGRDIEP